MRIARLSRGKPVTRRIAATEWRIVTITITLDWVLMRVRMEHCIGKQDINVRPITTAQSDGLSRESMNLLT